MALTDSRHDLPNAPNRLRDTPPPARCDAVWVTDITYVDTAEGWLYLAGVLDRHTRRCVGWAMADTLATSLPLAALDMALIHRRPPPRWSTIRIAACNPPAPLAAADVQPSMSRKGNCYNNAAMESFWSSLKRELGHRGRFATRAEARAAVFESIEIVYNRERFHSAQGYQSPVDFETLLN